MKKYILTILFLLITVCSSYSMAEDAPELLEWQKAFDTTNFDVGLDYAVVRVLTMGVGTMDLFAFASLDRNIDATNIFVSMYCAGVKSPEIVRLAETFFIRMSRAIEAYRTATVKCRLGVA
jgi:hypothetical protein